MLILNCFSLHNFLLAHPPVADDTNVSEPNANTSMHDDDDGIDDREVDNEDELSDIEFEETTASVIIKNYPEFFKSNK